MSDKNKAQDAEELPSDFSELFSEDEAEVQATEDSLDQLDAFIDDFDTNLDVGLDGEVYSDEPSLDEGDSVGDESIDLNAGGDEKESSVEAGQDELELNIPAAAVEPEATGSAPPLLSPAVAAASIALSRGQLIAGAAGLGIALLLSISALWMGMSLGSQLETLNQNVSELQQRLQVQSRGGSVATTPQLDEQMNRLDDRMNDLAVIVEGPLGHLRESNQQALQAIDLRLDRLEKGQATLPLVAAENKPADAVKVATAGELPESKDRAVAPSGVAASATPKEAWVINLLSLTSAKAANAELERLRKMGIRADKQNVNKDGKTWYRLRVTGFDSYEGAKAYIDTIKRQTGFNSAWVGTAQ